MKLEEIYWVGIKQFRELTDEFCSMDGEIERDGLPRYRIQIVEKHPSGEICARTTFSIKFDQIIAAHLQTHPVFQKDCRPFILWSVMEAIWNIKILKTEFGKPHVIQTILQPVQGGKIEITMGAEVLIDTGGITVVHLVNYANTHLLDQLGEIFKQNPDSKPPAEYLATKKREFYEGLKREKTEQHHRQLKNLKDRRTIGGEYVVFMDETGDLGFRNNPTEYVCAAFMVARKDLSEFQIAMKAIISKTWLNTAPAELHFTSITPRKRQAVLKEVGACFSKFGVETLCYIVQKPNFFLNLLRGEAESRRTEEKPIVTNIADKLADPDGHVGRKMLAAIIEEIVIHIGIDAVDNGFTLEFFHDRKRNDWMNQALEKGFQRGNETLKLYSEEMYGKSIVPTMSFGVVNSEQEPGVWVSDWLCWELGNWLRTNSWSDEFEQKLSAIKFLCFDSLGTKILIERPGGRILRKFPDLPRVINDIA